VSIPSGGKVHVDPLELAPPPIVPRQWPHIELACLRGRIDCLNEILHDVEAVRRSHVGPGLASLIVLEAKVMDRSIAA